MELNWTDLEKMADREDRFNRFMEAFNEALASSVYDLLDGKIEEMDLAIAAVTAVNEVTRSK